MNQCPMCPMELRQLHLTAHRLVRAWNRWQHLVQDDRIRLIVQGDINDLAQAVDGVEHLLTAHYEHQRNPV